MFKRKLQLFYFILLAGSGGILIFISPIYALCMIVCCIGYFIKNNLQKLSKIPNYNIKSSKIGLIIQLIGSTGILAYTILKFFWSQDV